MKAISIVALNLHVSKGQVWTGETADLARNSAQTVAEFVASGALAAVERVHLMGSRSNAELIVALYDQKQKGNLADIQVATPLLCRSAEERRRPEEVLFRLVGFVRSTSQGGFHSVNEDDYRAYALSAATMSQAGSPNPVTKDTLRMLRAHPAWKALAFIPHIDPVACVGLLSLIIDPRWYIDMCKPDNLSKLENSLGMNPKTQAGVTISGHRRWRRHSQCALVRACWKQPALEQIVRKRFDVVTPLPIEGSTEPGLAPGDFPWRVWGMRNAIGLPEATANPVVADLRASQCFIAFLRHTWIAALYRGSPGLPERGADLFRPADFFKHPSEIAAYEMYMMKHE